MAKKSRTKARERASDGEVGPREPCPCGSGKRYKACHGSAGGAYVARPFAGLVAERDLVALREFVPSATAPLTVGDRTVLLGSLLPGAAPAMVRASGDVWLGMQVRHSFGDPARDLGAVLEKALASDGEGVVGLVDPPGPGARLQDLVADQPLDVAVHEGFEWWLGDVADRDQDMVDALEQANGAVAPTVRLSSVDAAYWVDAGSKEHLRWVLPQDETALLGALARLHAAGDDSIADGSKLVGMFRAHGLLTPVWDLPSGTGAAAIEQPVAAFGERLARALATDTVLTPEERAAHSMLANQQVTLR
jgi:hypothetical protein